MVEGRGGEEEGMRAYKVGRSRMVEDTTVSHVEPTHMDVAAPGPTFVHVIELFLQLLLCGREGVPLSTL